MKVGIIAAMSREYAQITALLSNSTQIKEGLFEYTKGTLGGNEILLMQCGIGKVNAAVGATELIRNFSPDVVISSGVAGGIDPSLAVMDIVASSEIVYHDVWCGEGNEYGQVQGLPRSFMGDEELLQIATSLAVDSTIHAGLICSGDKFITNRAELDEIKGNFSAGLAVDMESAAIAQVCYLYGVRFISFRVVSDTPGVKDHEVQYENFWDTIADRSFSAVEALLSKIR